MWLKAFFAITKGFQLDAYRNLLRWIMKAIYFAVKENFPEKVFVFKKSSLSEIQFEKWNIFEEWLAVSVSNKVNCCRRRKMINVRRMFLSSPAMNISQRLNWNFLHLPDYTILLLSPLLQSFLVSVTIRNEKLPSSWMLQTILMSSVVSFQRQLSNAVEMRRVLSEKRRLIQRCFPRFVVIKEISRD